MRLFLFLLSIVFFALPSIAQNSPITSAQKTGIISISGTGKINATPDMAYINSGVITSSKTAGEALKQNSNAMNQLINVLKNAGVENKDIQTSNFSISPQYSYNNQSNNQPPKIIAYRVSNSVSIIVRDLDNLGNIIDNTVNVGANNINSVSFSIDDDSALLTQARKKAMENAFEKAQLYANAANVTLGKILAISENTAFMPPPPIAEMAISRAMVADTSTPMQGGELTYNVNVFVQWELVQ